MATPITPYLASGRAWVQNHLKPHQMYALSLYLLTVFISFLYGTLATAPENYFSHKRNLVNRLFAKLGWFWTTVVFGFYVYKILLPRGQWQSSVARYAMVTLYWYLLTQWLLGPSFFDRIFVATGGQCFHDDGLIHSALHHAACKHAGGRWHGGHDVSGHCVLLIHASLFLWEELSWVFYSLPTVTRLRRTDREGGYALTAVGALLTLWWWMLVVTSVYFHGFREILSGCIFGVAGWAILYGYVFPRIPTVGSPSTTLAPVQNSS